MRLDIPKTYFLGSPFLYRLRNERDEKRKTQTHTYKMSCFDNTCEPRKKENYNRKNTYYILKLFFIAILCHSFALQQITTFTLTQIFLN